MGIFRCRVGTKDEDNRVPKPIDEQGSGYTDNEQRYDHTLVRPVLMAPVPHSILGNLASKDSLSCCLLFLQVSFFQQFIILQVPDYATVSTRLAMGATIQIK